MLERIYLREGERYLYRDTANTKVQCWGGLDNPILFNAILYQRMFLTSQNLDVNKSAVII